MWCFIVLLCQVGEKFSGGDELWAPILTNFSVKLGWLG